MEESSICDECMVELFHADMCHVCRRPSVGFMTCGRCLGKSKIVAVYIASEHSGIAKKLVHRMKYQPSRSTAWRIGQVIAGNLPYLAPETVVVHVPTTPSRVRLRGFDQSRAMAQSIASKLQLQRVTALVRLATTHQIGSRRKDRLTQMVGAFEVRNVDDIVGKTVLLVDDVYTTGATLESAAKEIKKAGAKRVLAAVFARPH